MSEIWQVIIWLSVGTFVIRMTGVIEGQRLPQGGPWARGLNALPGCLIVSLVAGALLTGGPNEWIAAAAAALTAILSRSLPLTMVVGIVAIVLLRQL